MRPVEALLRVLRDEGADRVFGNPGTTELPFVDALIGAPDAPEYVLGLHESAVVAMADGYARATRRPAFVSLHAAAGLANGLVGLLNASRSRTPLVVTAGQQDRRHLIQDPMLAGDLVRLASGAVKSAYDVQHAADLPVLLRRAFALAARPPAGPVFLSVPMDLLAEDTEVSLPPRSAAVPPAPAPNTREAAAVLAAARRPVIVAGDGVGREDAVAALVAIAETLGAAVYHQPMNDALDFPTGHPLYAGVLNPVNADIARTLAPYDVLFLAGCHAFNPHHYSFGPPIPPGMRVVQADSDPAEFGRNFPVELALSGGLAPTLRRLAAELADPPPPDASARAAETAARIAAARAATEDAARAALAAADGDVLDPLALGYAVASALPPRAVVVEEAITTGVLLRRVLRQDEPGGFVHTVGGGLGSGTGMAVGTALGRPGRPVVAVLGDGCATFGLQGLWSAARYGTATTFVVANNGEYRTLKETLDRWGSRATAAGVYPGLDLGLDPCIDPGIDLGIDSGLGSGPAGARAASRLPFTAAAEFFGVPAVRTADPDELAELVAKAPQRDGPLLIDVPVTGHIPARGPA
ncbi:thiamine pyrophosphate-binding protein [Thermopolyspora sp. NPDC052614]|uniref:thiamine pyrophosphate-binding protein n=1 Tax=Thermopolyspora sp. NPDC052614 TaxID=3155682 RepID=UPI00342358B8